MLIVRITFHVPFSELALKQNKILMEIVITCMKKKTIKVLLCNMYSTHSITFRKKSKHGFEFKTFHK